MFIMYYLAVNLTLISPLLEDEGLFARGNSWKVYYITAMCVIILLGEMMRTSCTCSTNVLFQMFND